MHHQEELQDNHEDSITMMLELHREMETLKRKNTEELNAQKEENTRLKQRIKTIEKVETE